MRVDGAMEGQTWQYGSWPATIHLSV